MLDLLQLICKSGFLSYWLKLPVSVSVCHLDSYNFERDRIYFSDSCKNIDLDLGLVYISDFTPDLWLGYD